MTVELFCGDCLDILPMLLGLYDMILADLPYGTTVCKWDTVIPFEPLWEQYKRLIKKRGAVVLFGAQPFTSALVMSNVEWFKYCWVWEKSRASGFLDANKRPLNNIEDIAIFGQGNTHFNPQMVVGRLHKRGSNGRAKKARVYGEFYDSQTESCEYYPVRTLRFPVCQKQQHPTQKPVALLEYLIRTYTNEGETVLDNVMGSGSTGVACVNTGRSFVGIEKEREYFETAKARIETAQNEMVQMEMNL